MTGGRPTNASLERRIPEVGEIDEITLARARAGDEAALTRLVVRYQSRLHALVGRMMAGRPSLVDDLAQESMLKVLGGLRRFDARGPAKLSTWILTIATRTCIDALRRPDRSVPLPPDLPSAADPEADAARRQLGRRVEQLMARLPDEARAALVLRAYHDFDYPEIASALGVEEGTVKSRLGRARAALRQALEENIP